MNVADLSPIVPLDEIPYTVSHSNEGVVIDHGAGLSDHIIQQE